MTQGPGSAAVAAGSGAAASAAAEVLRAGGNAVDAAVAAGFAAAVAEPGLSSLGGGGFALVREPGGDEWLLDFFVDAPGRGLPPDAVEPHFTQIVVTFAGADQAFHAGWGSVAVPGCLAGYLHLHAARGRAALDVVAAPAIRMASTGVPLEPAQAQVLGLLWGIVTLTDDGRRLFGPLAPDPLAGPKPPGTLRNPDYAHFLGQVATGAVTGFSSEPVAASLVTAMTEHSGLVTGQDLLAYRPIRRSPLVAEYAGARVATNALPSFGGAILVDALAVLGQRAPGRLGQQHRGAPSDSGGRAVAVLESLAEATDRQKQRAFSAAQSTQGTTHVSVVDGDGLTVSMTTSNGSCSGVFAPGTGVQLNNVMGERDLHPWGFHALRPGTRIGSMMAPTIVDLPDGSIVALGSGGSERIRSALLQTLVHLVDGRVLSDAVAAPRMHWDGDVLQVEPGLASEVAAAVSSVGPVNQWAARDLYFGGVQAVLRQPDGQVAAVGDPRRGGAGVVVTP